MDDLISRMTTIDAMYYKPNYKMAIEVLKEVPAVDAVPIIYGRWMKPERSLWPMANCSVCGKMCIVANTAKYCPNCGAKMENIDE